MDGTFVETETVGTERVNNGGRAVITAYEATAEPILAVVLEAAEPLHIGYETRAEWGYAMSMDAQRNMWVVLRELGVTLLAESVEDQQA